MERPVKLMEASLSQPLRICNESRKGSFSDLPDHVVHHILSFLSFKSLTQFNLASKRCRQLCLTNPFLTFDGTEFLKNSTLRIKLLNYCDRFLVEREGRKVRGLRIRWGFQLGILEPYRIITWLHVAVGCNLEELDLELYCRERENIEFPLCLFRCGSLRSVAVDLHGGFLVLPSSLGFCYLQSLSLTSVKMASNFGEWISSFCECLEELRLENIEEIHNVSITSSSLVRFTLIESRPSQLCHLRVAGGKLEVIDVLWRFNSSSGKSMKISAPSLKYLTWNGNPANDTCLDPFLQLEGARLFLEPREDSDSNLHKILFDVSSTKDLSVHDVMIKVLFEQGYLCPCLNYVHRLCMYISSLNDDLVPAMIFLLTGMPNLVTLSIKSSATLANTNISKRVNWSIKSSASSANFNGCKFRRCNIKSSTALAANKASGFDARYWVSQNLSIIRHLEMVEIELFNGINALELVLFLLKHAKKLKKMIVFHSPSLPSDTFMKIRNCRMGSAATVVFREK